MQELFLFPNYKAKNNYLKNNFKKYTLDITNYQTLHQYYKSSKERFFENYRIENNVQDIDESIAIINIHNILFQYKEKNKEALISKQNTTYELAYTLYKLIEEITLAKFYGFRLDEYDNLKDINTIINLYKEYNKENNLLDEFDIFELFIKSIENNELEFLNTYESIKIYNFEKIPPLHLIFLESLKKHYNKNIKIIMPYSMDKHFNNYKSFFQGIDNFEVSQNSNFAKALIGENKDIKKYKDKIKFISGFGAKQETDTVIDEIIKLIDSGVNPYDIGIIFSDIQLYSDIVSNRLKECQIKFNERRANFIWRVPIIPVLTSIFLILDKYNGEIDVDALIKILSSSYIKLEGINPYNIRDLIYSYEDYNSIEIFSKMSFKDFKNRISKKFQNNDASKSISDLLDLLNILVSKKSYKEIGLAYINILKFLNIENTENIKDTDNIDNNKNEYFYRDNEALALFINLILEIAYTEKLENIQNQEISHFDFHAALNTILRDKSIGEDNDRDISLTVSNLYDARGLKLKHIFILGLNNDFINRRPNAFFISAKLREEINRKNKKIIFNTQSYLSDIHYVLFLNILSCCYEDSNIYFSFRFKDEKGNLEIPFYYIENLYRELYNEDFKFESLDKNGLIYRKEYIQREDNIHTDKENLMSLFLYNTIAYKIDNAENIIDTVYHKQNKNMHHDFNNNEDIKNFFLNILKEKVSVTTLQAIMECPAKFFYSKLYSKESVESKIQGINYMDRGRAYHKFFQDFYKEVKNKYSDEGCHLIESEFNNYCNIANQVVENHINDLINMYSSKDLEEKYVLEYKFDFNVIKEEALNVMSSFIKKEIITNKIKEEDEGCFYIPTSFEKYIGSNYKEDFIIYQNKDLSIKIKGIADRIDFSYSDKEHKNINGIRIVDYKSSYKIEEAKGETQKDIIRETIRIYLQPILYLKYILNEYIKKNISEKIKYCEVVFTVYKEKDVINESQEINQMYNDRDMLLSICGYIDSEYNLNDYFDEVFNKILEGELVYISNSTNCENCYNAPYCEKVYKKDDDEN
ncbi:PD-(D/E)XK nuclease family protein [Brachyspira hyodysenteriae]|uniref:PD-(D/E)XK nuclease family protein n=1 Tax=Brachyspira hyodysenteriae TaxID=159 RepID=UPI0022CD3B8A|nr:PD-(D/E)XK nuclease family protein [Brachyspira hyodysenteriae]MCZ9961705.1 PD-(D/E)XK nuclease family protein [Brachyspira hyodysenteriae]